MKYNTTLFALFMAGASALRATMEPSGPTTCSITPVTRELIEEFEAFVDETLWEDLTTSAIHAILDHEPNKADRCCTDLVKIKTGSNIENVKFFGLDGHRKSSDRNIDAYYEGEISCSQLGQDHPTPNGFGRLMVQNKKQSQYTHYVGFFNNNQVPTVYQADKLQFKDNKW